MSPGAPVLSQRALNRATLARQLLLERHVTPVADVLERLVGMQAQLPNAPYVALWSRLAHFQPDELSELVASRQAVRISLMRATIHLVTALDALRLRPLLQPALERDVYPNSTYGRARLAGLDIPELLAVGRGLVAKRALTNAELRAELARRWPDRDAAALAYAVRGLLPMVHVPPRGIWQRSGPIALTTVETYLGRPLERETTLDQLILRYLAAFGPASVADAQTWSRLTSLGEVFERLRPQLLTFVNEQGRELFDLPDAPRPDPDTPAPVRFLPEYDNVLLGHDDRRRFVSDDLRRRVASEGLAVGSILVDGEAGGTWTVARDRATVSLTIRPVEPMSEDTRSTVADEATHLLEFLGPKAGQREVAFGNPA